MSKLNFRCWISAVFLLSSSCYFLSAATYYVSPAGNDNNNGSYGSPWQTWQKGFSMAEAGDTVYFRGGIYRPAKSAYWSNINMIKPGDGIGHNGTYDNPICFFNYPGEKPVLDCSSISPTGNYNTGIDIEYGNFLKFKGLTIRNIRQVTGNVFAKGIVMYACSNLTFENVTIHNIDGPAFNYYGAMGRYGIAFDSTRFINCDAYNLRDALGDDPGNLADGWKADNYENAYLLFKGCRAWNCSDDGFDVSGMAYTVFEQCWAFNIGNFANGNGNGFKIGAVRDSLPYPARIVKNCLAAFCHNPSTNAGTGFLEIDYPINDSAYYRVNARIFNNTAFKNDIGYMASENPSKRFRNSEYRNNIGYKSTHVQDGVAYDVLVQHFPYPESGNTWHWQADSWPPYFDKSDSVTVTDNDFITLDSTGISGPRKPDGSLPDINFLHLAAGSDLIDAGTYVGIPFTGKRPDIGYSEYPIPVDNIVVSSENGATSINTNNGSLQLKATITPQDAANQAISWSVVNGTGKARINNSGVITAIADGTVFARATSMDGSGKYGQLQITIENQVLHTLDVVSPSGSNSITVDNGTLQLLANIAPAGEFGVTWSVTSGSSLATISTNGLVTAVNNGTITVRATANDESGLYDNFAITISNQVIPVSSISVTAAGGATTISTDNGTLQLNASVAPSNATNNRVVWSLTNGSSRATISSTGLITAISNGSVVARATAADGSGVYGTLSLYLSNQIVPVTDINISAPNGATSITSNKGTLQLTATVLPSAATNKNITWTVQSGSRYATVSSSGLVTAAANGNVIIRATSNDGSGIYETYAIAVSNQNVTVTGITVSSAGGATILTTGSTLQLSAAISPSTASNKNVTWSLQNGTGRGSISSSGLVTATSAGTIIARATAADGSGVFGTFTMNIANSVILVTAISVSGEGSSKAINTNNGTLQMTANIVPANATTKAVTWTVTNGTGEATINSSGLLTAVANGIVMVRATATDGSTVYGVLNVTISNQISEVTDVEITTANGSKLISEDDGTLQLFASVLPEKATNKTITWSVQGGTAQVTVSPSGLVTAISNGTAIIRATSNDGSGVYGTITLTISNQVVSVTGIQISGMNGLNIISKPGESLQIVASVSPVDATVRSVIWSVQNITGRAIISNNGLVTATATGIIKVTATANDGSGVTDELEIVIGPDLVLSSSIVVYARDYETRLNLNDTVQLFATVNPDNASNKQVVWSVENKSGNASVDENGVLKALAYGEITVWATATDGSGVKGSLNISIENVTDRDDIEDQKAVIFNNRITLFIKQPEYIFNKAWIYNVSGQIILSEDIADKLSEISISDLTTGMYLIILTNDKGGFCRAKFVKP